MSDILIIGYGNTLRSDDGVGPRLVEELRRQAHPGVRALSVHQLVPELAEQLAHARRVIFVDASLEQGGVECRCVEPAPANPSLLHTGGPGWLLALTETVSGIRPQAWLITIPVANLDLGEDLSPLAREGMHTALQLISNML